jgi:hypothetical protein
MDQRLTWEGETFAFIGIIPPDGRFHRCDGCDNDHNGQQYHYESRTCRARWCADCVEIVKAGA